MSERDQKIRQRAYEIWEREGRPDGNHGEHWDRAAREIDEQEAAPAGSPTGTGDMGSAGPGGLSTGSAARRNVARRRTRGRSRQHRNRGASSAGRASGSVKHSGS